MSDFRRGEPGLMRASDADREEAAAVLERAAAEGRLTLDELDQRVRLAYSAKTFSELRALTDDLPAPGVTDPLAAPPPARPGEVVDYSRDQNPEAFCMAVLGGAKRSGSWRVPPNFTAVAVLGSLDLDLRHARLSGPEVTIQALCVMGGVRVIVGEDMDLEVSGTGVLGPFDHPPERPARPGAPLVRVTGLSVLGGVEVCRAQAGPGAARPGLPSGFEPLSEK